MNISTRNVAELDPESFKALARLTYDSSGIQLVEEKRSMIQSRLRHRLSALGMSEFASYSKFVCSNDGLDERRHMISALTTNVSHFFRENHHFETLTKEIIPKLAKKMRAGERVRIWSAGSSNGQEACSIAMTFLENIPELGSFDFRILATDIDPKVVAFSNEGTYPDRMLDGVSPAHLQRYFEKATSPTEPSYRTKQCIRDLIRFRELNLLKDWPIKQKFDVIFCRNVVIYFDLATQNNLWPRFLRALQRDGHLFLGHSERISEPEAAGFIIQGTTTYRPAALFSADHV